LSNVREIVLPGEQTEKCECEYAVAGQIGSVFGAWIGNLAENFGAENSGKMGTIVLHKNLRDECVRYLIRFSRRFVGEKI